jgi:predicted esterase
VCFAFLLISTLAGVSVVSATTAPTNQDDDMFIYIPTNAAARGPLQVLVTVHGMGGDGTVFCQPLINRAEQDGWILVSPTYHYRDNFNPSTVRQDDTELIPRLKQYLDNLPAKTGLLIRDKVLFYGFSRGGQIVHRFAEFYPEKTLAVAVFAAGTYTLPVSSLNVDGAQKPLDLPFGVADVQQYTNAPFNLDAFKKVPFFIGVGGADDHAGDAPPAWDQYVGSTRLARSQNFAHALQNLGMDVSLTVFPGVGHDITSDMRAQAMSFLEWQAFAATIASQDHAIAASVIHAAAA